MLYLSNAPLNYLHKLKKNKWTTLCHRDDTYPAAFLTFDPSFVWNNENRKNAQLGVKSFNIKFTGHEIQFDPGFIPLSCEWTKIEKVPNWA